MPCQPTTILWGDQAFAVPIEEGSSGDLVSSTELSGVCNPLPSQSSDGIAQALAGKAAILTVSRTWVYTPKTLNLVESAFVAVDDPPPWTLVFSDWSGSSRSAGQRSRRARRYLCPGT
jgi:hypothetical protein